MTQEATEQVVTDNKATPPIDSPAEPAKADAPAEPAPVEQPPTPTALDVAKRFEQAKRAEMLRRKADAEIKRAAAAHAELETKAKALAEREAKIRELEELLEADPIEFAKRSKANPEHLAKRFLSPETPAEREIRLLKEQLKAEKEEREQTAKTAEKTAREQAMVAFVREITPDECPHLTALYEAWEVPRLVERALAEHGPAFVQANGRNPTNEEIRAFLETQAKNRATTLIARQKPTDASDGNGQPVTNGPGTLTNTHAAQSATPAPVKDKPLNARLKELAARLEAEDRE